MSQTDTHDSLSRQKKAQRIIGFCTEGPVIPDTTQRGCSDPIADDFITYNNAF